MHATIRVGSPVREQHLVAYIDIHHLSSRGRSGCPLPINLAERGELLDLAEKMTTVVWLAMNIVSGRNVRVVISNVRPYGKGSPDC